MTDENFVFYSYPLINRRMTLGYYEAADSDPILNFNKGDDHTSVANFTTINIGIPDKPEVLRELHIARNFHKWGIYFHQKSSSLILSPFFLIDI